MNKLIQKLYDRACDVEKNTLYYITGLVHPDAMQISRQDASRTFNPEKFAELIVRECANHCDLLLDHKISSEWSRGTHDCSRAIKKHFGVKE